ncbi:hypothetical protein TorRG33x02_220300 [Trema orientale]|uniref:Uncharacterized protein n=1 Tax=Trema orientale TaxID=63057 RepID=A0A2P5E9F8_TREOI|nr:hypothetical protein TorRG33x02_220300 [Trema orientale]
MKRGGVTFVCLIAERGGESGCSCNATNREFTKRSLSTMDVRHQGDSYTGGRFEDSSGTTANYASDIDIRAAVGGLRSPLEKG